MNWRGWRAMSWIGVAGLAVALAYSLFQHDLRAIIFFSIYLTVAAVIVLVVRLPSLLTALLVLSLAINATGWGWRFLDTVWHYDKLAHCVTTLAVTVAASLYLFRPLRAELRAHPFLFGVILVSLGLGANVLWETYEWISDHFVHPPGQMTLSDTMTDLLGDLLGALLAVPLGLRVFEKELPPPGGPGAPAR